MFSNKKNIIINKDNCAKAVEKLLNSEEYLNVSLEISKLHEIKLNSELAKLICAALGISFDKKNIDKICRVYIKNPGCSISDVKKNLNDGCRLLINVS